MNCSLLNYLQRQWPLRQQQICSATIAILRQRYAAYPQAALCTTIRQINIEHDVVMTPFAAGRIYMTSHDDDQIVSDTHYTSTSNTKLPAGTNEPPTT